MTFKDCFVIDQHKYNPVPKNWFKRINLLYSRQRYSMPVFLRLTEYFYEKSVNSKTKITRKIMLGISNYCRRKNETLNQFEHGYFHNIAPGTLFHHTGVTLTNNIKIGKNVQIFKNVTLALVNGKTCEIGDNSVIFSHVLILGKKIGKNCVIGGGSIVIHDVPDNSVVAGNPAKIIKRCENAHDYLESK